MKLFFLLASLTAAVGSAQAQHITAGTFALGGGLSYYFSSGSSSGTVTGNINEANQSSNASNQYQISALPIVSYFIADNLAIGIIGGYSHSYSKQEFTNSFPALNTSTLVQAPGNSFSIGLFSQYYKMLNAQFGLTSMLSATYSYGQSHTYYDDDVTGNHNNSHGTSSGYGINVTPGVVFFPIPRLGFTATVGSFVFSHNHSQGTGFSIDTTGSYTVAESEGTSNSGNAHFGLNQLVLGANYYFGR